MTSANGCQIRRIIYIKLSACLLYRALAHTVHQAALPAMRACSSLKTSLLSRCCRCASVTLSCAESRSLEQRPSNQLPVVMRRLWPPPKLARKLLRLSGTSHASLETHHLHPPSFTWDPAPFPPRRPSLATPPPDVSGSAVAPRLTGRAPGAASPPALPLLHSGAGGSRAQPQMKLRSLKALATCCFSSC